MIRFIDPFEEDDIFDELVDIVHDYCTDKVVLAYNNKDEQFRQISNGLDRIGLQYKLFEISEFDIDPCLIIRFLNEHPTTVISGDSLAKWIETQQEGDPMLEDIHLNKLCVLYEQYKKLEAELENYYIEKYLHGIPSYEDSPEDYYQDTDTGDMVYFGDYEDPEDRKDRWIEEQHMLDEIKLKLSRIKEEYDQICNTSKSFRDRIEAAKEKIAKHDQEIANNATDDDLDDLPFSNRVREIAYHPQDKDTDDLDDSDLPF